MKITKRQLKRIIREEKARVLEMLGTREQQLAAREYSKKQRAGEKPKVNMNFQRNDPGTDLSPGDMSNGLLQINNIVDQLLQAGADPDELQAELESIALSVTDLDHLQP